MTCLEATAGGAVQAGQCMRTCCAVEFVDGRPRRSAARLAACREVSAAAAAAAAGGVGREEGVGGVIVWQASEASQRAGADRRRPVRAAACDAAAWGCRRRRGPARTGRCAGARRAGCGIGCDGEHGRRGLGHEILDGLHGCAREVVLVLLQQLQERAHHVRTGR